MKKKYSLLFALTLMLIASALTCLAFMLASCSQLFENRNNKNAAAGREFAALLDAIEESYIGEYDLDEVTAAAMRALVEALGDDWSYYLTPEEYRQYLNTSGNRFAGIGVSVELNEEAGGMIVLGVYKGSPAETAGILAGEVITAVDGESIAGYSLEEIRGLLARPLGESALVTVLRLDGSVEEITVVYDLVFNDPISFEMLEGYIGYIDIANFDGGTADSFNAAVDLLLEQGARALIFDVRANPGGMVYEVTEMLDYLLPEGEIFISVSREGEEEITYSGPEMIDIPAVVLVNRHSYSAAEYFAAILMEYGYADVVGEHTTGKSRSQRTLMLPNGGALHISTHQYLTKNRVALYDIGGLTPDYEINMTDEEYSAFVTGMLDKNDDPHIRWAIALIMEKNI